MNAIDLSKPATHRVTLGGESALCTIETFTEVSAALVAKYPNAGIPVVEPLSAPVVRVPARIPAKRSATATPVTTIGIGQMDTAGRDRSALDRDAAVLAGFAPKAPVYERGLRATGMGEHKQEFEALPETCDAMNDLVRRVESEDRSDSKVLQGEIRMRASGLIVLGGGQGADLQLTDRALPSLTNRLGMPAGAGTYLKGIRPEVRAINVNRWCAEDVAARDAAEYEAAVKANELLAYNKRKELPLPSDIVLRTRKAVRGDREVFGVVSDGYSPFDADLVARAINRAVDSDGSRAEVVYDGYRTKVDVMWFSNIEPSHAVAGEYFKAGIRVRTDDTGGGSCRVSAIVWQNLCLNFIIIDQAQQDIAVIRHVGDVAALAKRFEASIQTAQGKLGHFIEAWGSACEEDVLARSLDLAKASGVIESVAPFASLLVSQALPGIFNGIIERDLVPVPKRARVEVVADLMSMWKKDVSGATLDKEGRLSRGAVVNAFTRWAHEKNDDAFKAHDVEAAAGALLYGAKGGTPAPLPFLPMQ